MLPTKASLVWLCAAAQDAMLNFLDCDLCKCSDRFWPNCTMHCQGLDINAPVSLDALDKVLNEIGEECQVWADITLPQTLKAEEWCMSENDERPGYILSTPPSSTDGYNVVRGRMKQEYVIFKGGDLECSKSQVDSYATFHTDISPSPNYCPMADLPANLTLQTLQIDKGSVIIPLTNVGTPVERMNTTEYGFYDSEVDLDSFQPVTLRYFRNGRGEGSCYGDPDSIVFVREFDGFFNGRRYSSFRFHENPGVLKKAVKHAPQMWTGRVGQRPMNNAIWDNEDFRYAPGFDHMAW
ncbi:hypothetical protein GNI_031990 [Gregarina niphandrodes]|uniref:Transmembrane protein n=1 Tax=Gregarina niphandrodes TaxID=110365 RepID=A0A023BB53_GRENI|nr:hypothetical protein GNI_031990 [Gregarina niphandrodes]EZG78821.1 hypothetical protein GNI_031990 [Gregarina niphandrodes]|eukprot:XP_011129188.1 hypothetical protein GNI_031990 [Gregarina niphandrodes]